MAELRQRGRVRPLSIAPMMDRTDRFYRAFVRLLTRHTLLYTEMVTMNAVLHGDRDYLLGYDDEEHPIALQLGGDDPTKLAECAKIAVDYGYDEVNINVGCPSSRVQNGNFGVCLMKTPEVVGEAVSEMRAAVDVPITVKHRIGVDELDRFEDMAHFVRVVAQAKPDRFTVHARKAWLQGLSPKENRNVPPLRYDDVYRLKREFPDEIIEINGGITTLEDTEAHLEHVDAVMIGRAAWDRPWIFADADARLFDDPRPVPRREEIAEAFIPYVQRWTEAGIKPTHLLRNVLNLFSHQPGGRRWRRMITENHRAGAEAIRMALRDRERLQSAA